MSAEPILEYWPEGILAARIPANNNVRLLQALKINPAISASTAAQPGSPDEGDVYILPASPSGTMWAGFNEGDVVIFYEDTWTAYAPIDGLRKFVIDEGEDWQYIGGSGGSWAAAGGGGGGGLPPDGTYADIVVSGSGTAWNIAAGVVGPTELASTAVTPGSYTSANITVDADGRITAAANGSGGGGSPGGSDTQIQFNDTGAFGGDAGLVYNKTSDTLTLVNGTFTGLALTAASATGSAGLRLPHGAAPTSPTNGDVWTTTAGMYVRVNGVTVGPLAAAGGGSLTNWTEGFNNSPPNDGSVATCFFTATNAATHLDAVLSAKGIGATLAQIPDSTTTGGNKRGSGATDWQKVRSSANQVAGGDQAGILSGSNNRASGQQSVTVGGLQNHSSGTYAGNLAGNLNLASGAASANLGGTENTASAADSATLGGANNDADGQYSTAMGFKAQARGIIGAWAKSCGGFNNVDGDGQDRQFYMVRDTSNATQATATTNRGAADTTNQIVLPNNSAFVVKGTINARENATEDSSAWDFTAYIKRGASAANTAMVVACTPVLIGQDTGAAAWAVSVDADTSNGSLRCRVTGEASHSIKWGWSIYSCNEVVS